MTKFLILTSNIIPVNSLFIFTKFDTININVIKKQIRKNFITFISKILVFILHKYNKHHSIKIKNLDSTKKDFDIINYKIYTYCTNLKSYTLINHKYLQDVK